MNVLRASTTLQKYLHIFNRWFQKWKINVNETKSYLTFKLRKDPSPPIYLNEVEIPPAKTVKYLGLYLDTKLIWRPHNKEMETDGPSLQRILLATWQVIPLSINNKHLLYKTVIAPIWTYDLELRGCASKSNIAIIQRFQSKLLRAISNAPWYITNAMIHSDLGIRTGQDVIHVRSNKHRAKL